MNRAGSCTTMKVIIRGYIYIVTPISCLVLSPASSVVDTWDDGADAPSSQESSPISSPGANSVVYGFIEYNDVPYIWSFFRIDDSCSAVVAWTAETSGMEAFELPDRTVIDIRDLEDEYQQYRGQAQ